MGGARNGRILRLAIGMVVVVFILYMVYLYHTAKGELEDTHQRLAAVSRIHERLTKELKDSIQNHAQLAGELKDERNSHFKTVSEKDHMQQRCTEDIANLRKTCESEKSLLTDQNNSLMDQRDRLTAARDSFEAKALKFQTSLTDLQGRHQTLTDNCNQQGETAKQSIQLTQERVKQLEGELARARSSLQDTQQRQLQCNTELDQNRQKVISLDTDSRNKIRQIEVLEQQVRSMQDRIASLEDDNQKLEHRLKQQQLEHAAKYQPQLPDARNVPQLPDARNVPRDAYAKEAQPGVVRSQEPQGEVRREAPSERPAGLDDVKITDQQKEVIFQNLHEKIRRGETLTEKQSQIYQLLLKQARNSMGGNVDQAAHHRAQQEQLPPDPNGRNQQQLPAQPGLNENFVPHSQQQAGLIHDRPAFPAKPPQPPPPPPPPGGQQPDGFGMRQQQPNGFGVRRQQPGGFGVRQQQPDGFGVRQQQPDGFGMRQQQPDGFGMRQQQPDGFGVSQQQPDGFGMRQQQPDGFRVRQQQPGGFGMGQQPGFGLRQPPGGMEPHQAHSEQRSLEEQEEVQDIADPGKEGGQQLQFDNLGDEKQQKLKLEDELEGGAQQAFDPGEIVKQAGKDTNAAKQGENDNPLPQPADENQNPDQKFDDYGNNKDDDDGDEEYEYEEDRYGDRQLGKDRQEHRKNLNVEHQLQQPALRETGVQRPGQQKQRLNEMR